MYENDDIVTADFAYLMSILLKEVNPRINAETAEELLFAMMSTDMDEFVAVTTGRLIAATAGSPNSDEIH